MEFRMRLSKPPLELPPLTIETIPSSPTSLTTRASPNAKGLLRHSNTLESPLTKRPNPIKIESKLPQMNLRKPSAPNSPNKSSVVSSFSAIFSEIVRTNLNKGDESSCFYEAKLDLNKWAMLAKAQNTINLKKDFAVHRMKSSTLVVKSSMKCKSSIPLVLHESKPVSHVYVIDSSSNLETQKERALAQIYAKSSRLQKKYSQGLGVSKRRMAGLAK